MDLGDLGINGERLLQRIRDLRFPSLTLVDVGVRLGTSSTIMLEASLGRPSRVIGIDASEIPAHLKANPRYQAIESTDSVTALSEMREPVHCCWIDTLHCAHQAAAEAYYLWPLMPVGSLLCLHDTAWGEGKRDHYCDRDWPTVDKAVDWIFEARHYCEVRHHVESWGTTFVTKTKEAALESRVPWSEIFAGRNQLLAILPEGVRRREIVL